MAVHSKLSSCIDILFHDSEVNLLFSDLLSSLKINNRVLELETDIIESDYVITEFKYYNLIRESSDTKCIVVGETTRVESSNTIQLAQPLTEKKILAALSFLMTNGTH